MTDLTITIFSTQQLINAKLINAITNASIFSFLIAFTGGLFTSISPCILSSIPVAVLYINQRKNKFVSTGLLLAGIITALLGIGFISIFLKQFTWPLVSKIPLIWPIIIVFLGLNLLEILQVKAFKGQQNKWYNGEQNQTDMRTYFLGVALGITLSPCSTPITITLIAWISATKQYMTGIYLLFMYTFGYIMPLLISIISINNLNTVQMISRKSYIIVNILGFTTIGTGSYAIFKEILSFL